MAAFHIQAGQEVSFAKTIGETDIYLFAGITGDFSPNHVNEQVMSGSRYGRRIAHGALLVGYMSTASTRAIETFASAVSEETAVSLGYDRIRFLRAVGIGDTVTVRYKIRDVDPERRRSRADISVTDQDGALVAVAEHILKWVPNRP
ncbi:MAG: MaoC/PaaZ C-terminal domain-containing protein [Acetobacteraceae bacterium]